MGDVETDGTATAVPREGSEREVPLPSDCEIPVSGRVHPIPIRRYVREAELREMLSERPRIDPDAMPRFDGTGDCL